MTFQNIIAAPSAPPPPFAPLAEENGVAAPLRSAYPTLDVWLQAGVPPAAALRRLGLTLWSAGQLEAAAEVLRAAAEADGGDVAAALDLGFCLRSVGRPRASWEAFAEATRRDPLHARAWLALGLAFKEFGDNAAAEDALRRSTALEGAPDDAAYSLGLICFETRRYEEAARWWRPIGERGYATGAIRAGLGQCCFFLGAFAEAARWLGAHLEQNPDDREIGRRRALTLFLDAADRIGPEAARTAYAAAVPPDAEPVEKIARAAIMLLAGYGREAAALAVARAFPAEGNGDPILDHHVAALSGERRAQAPTEYVCAYFDRFADSFDSQMAVLGYRGPEELLALVRSVGARPRRTLDLGCGSGGAGALLRLGCERLVGVDLSPRMIDKARERGVFDELHVSDMAEYLTRQCEAFDLIFAADSLIYVGDLAPLLEAATGALAPGGLFAFTLETTSAAPYVLQSSGRFAHSPRAVLQMAKDRFELRASRRAFLRLEANRRIHGAFIVLERSA